MTGFFAPRNCRGTAVLTPPVLEKVQERLDADQPISEITEQDRALIEAAYRDKVGGVIGFEVRLVEDIPLTARGKLKILDSQLNTNNGSPELAVIRPSSEITQKPLMNSQNQREEH
jgi:hypothetical protein